MSLRPFSSKLKFLAMLIVLLVSTGVGYSQEVDVIFRKFDPIANSEVAVSSLILRKGELGNDGETLKVYLNATANNLNNIRRVNIRVVNLDDSELFDNSTIPPTATAATSVPPLIQIRVNKTSAIGGLFNNDIPAVNPATNERGFKEFVFFPYMSLPYLYRMDTLNYDNPANPVLPATTEQNFSYVNTRGNNYAREIADPRVNYDVLRSKLFFNSPSTAPVLASADTHIVLSNNATSSFALPATSGSTNMRTDLEPLKNIGIAPAYDWRPDPAPSVGESSIPGILSGIHTNQFVFTASGTSAVFDLPIKALEWGGNGPVKMVFEIERSIFPPLASPIIVKTLVINVQPNIANMALSLQLDGETIGNGNTITTVAGKDINLRVFVTRTVNASNPYKPTLEGPSGAQEYLTIDTGLSQGVNATDDSDIGQIIVAVPMWSFRNFDETIFDLMEFNPSVIPGPAPAVQYVTSQSTLFQGITGRQSWQHAGLHMNIQTWPVGAGNPPVRPVSSTLFNDLPYLIRHDNDPNDGNASGNAMRSNGRYTFTPFTRVGLLLETAPERFMYSQARLYSRDAAALRENIPQGEFRYTANLFQNISRGTNQRAITFVPQEVGTFNVTVNLMSADGTVTIDSQTAVINVIPEIINVETVDTAEPEDVQAKPVRALDLITYQEKRITSTHSDFGITSMSIRLEGIGLGNNNLLWGETTGVGSTARSYGEVDLDDIGYFGFLIKGQYAFYYRSPNHEGIPGIPNSPDQGIRSFNDDADVDGDRVERDNFYENNGRPEPVHLQNNGIDDDNDGVIDDKVYSPTGRAESAAIRISLGARSAYYQGGTLNNFYDVLGTPSYLSMIDEVAIPQGGRSPTDNFAPIPTSAGIPDLILNEYIGRVTAINNYTVIEDRRYKPIKRARKVRYVDDIILSCDDPKQAYFLFTHQIPWYNRNGQRGYVPISFGRVGSDGGITTAFSFVPTNSVTDKKMVSPYADTTKYPTFTNPAFQAAGNDSTSTYQNFSTTFKFSGGTTVNSGGFVNRMTNNYRPFLNMFEPRLTPPLDQEVQFANLAGLNGWVYTYNDRTAIVINDGLPAEGMTWVVEQRVGPILDLPDAIYTINDPENFVFSKYNHIIVPEEDSRWRPDDTGKQGFESWFRFFPIREVIAMESRYVALFGIDEAFDEEHTQPRAGEFPTADPDTGLPYYLISYLSPSAAYQEVAGNNSALQMFLPSEMLDNGIRGATAPFALYEDSDNSGTFNFAIDRVISVLAPQRHYFNALTRSFYTYIDVPQGTEYDTQYDELYDFFVVTRFDSGYPDVGTGAPPFNIQNSPDSSPVRFGIKLELFKPNSFPKSSPSYANFMDRDGKEERETQDNYFVINVRVDNDDVDLVVDIYADCDHPLEKSGYVVHQGGAAVYAMTNLNQVGGLSDSGSTKDLRSPELLLKAGFPKAVQAFGGTVRFNPFTRKEISDLILYGDATRPALFPPSSQFNFNATNGILWNHIHLPVLPSAETSIANFDRNIERENTWRNDVYAQVRPYERDKNGNGICDPGEDFNSDGMFTQDVVLLRFKPEVYSVGHPRAGQSFYNETNDFLNMADIRWSIVKNESGGFLSSETGYLIPGDSTGTNYVTYYPGSLNGLDYVKGENIKTGRSLIAVMLVINNPATDGVDNDNDTKLSSFVTTMGEVLSNASPPVNLHANDPRYSIRCINPTAVGISLANFPNIDFADDDFLDGAGSLNPDYDGGLAFTSVATGVTNVGNATATVDGNFEDILDLTVTLTATGTGTVGSSFIPFAVVVVNPNTNNIVHTRSVTLANGSTSVVVYTDSFGSSVTVTFSNGSSILVGDRFTFTMYGNIDWDGDGWSRGDELGNVPGAMFPETNVGYSFGIDIDLSWNNPRPFYAIKVLATKTTTAGSWDGSFGSDYVFTTQLNTKEVVGSGVWTSTVEMQLNDQRYLGAGGLLGAAPIGLSGPGDSNPGNIYFRSMSIVNNTTSSSYTAGNLLVVSENQFYTPAYRYVPENRVARGGTDLYRLTQNPNAVIKGEWMDLLGESDIYYRTEVCALGIDFTVDGEGRIVYDFDISTMPGDHTRYAAAVFESNHTITDYITPQYGLLRIDPNSMPTPVLQLNSADTSDPITLTFTDGERLQKIRVNFINVRGFKPTKITDDPNTRYQDTMLAPLSNDMLGGISLWKDNKDPDNSQLGIPGGQQLITEGRNSGTGSKGHFDALVDVVVDLDGWNSPRAYTNYKQQFSNPLSAPVVVPGTSGTALVSNNLLSKFSPSDKIYFVDRDGSKSYSLGDDIYFDQGQPGLDNGDRIIYTQRGLGSGPSYNLGDPAHNERLRYFDENRNGKYDNGEDIVYEGANLNGRWDLPIDQYIPLDKDALRWRWDKENNLWYIVLDLENDEEVPPEDIFTDLRDYVAPPSVANLATLNFPGGVIPHFYRGSDYHVCIRTSLNMDYLTAFMVEIPDYWKHTQALTDFDDIAGVWLATQPAIVTYPSMPGSSVISPVIVANMPVNISDEVVDRPTREKIGRNSKPFPVLGINLVDNTYNSLKLGNDLLKTVFGSNSNWIDGARYGVRLNTISGNRKTVLEDLVVELFNNMEGTVGGGTTSGGTIVPPDFNPVSDLLALDRRTKGDDIFRSVDGTGVFKSATDTKILRLGSVLINGRMYQDDLTEGKQGKQDANIVFIDINGNNVYDDNLDILVYDIDGLTSNGLPTGTRTFKFGDAILKRGFSNWDTTSGAINDVSKLTPNDISLIIGKQLKYDSSLWFEDDDESGGFSNEGSQSGVAMYRDRSDSSPYDNGKFDFSVSSKNEIIVLDEVIYLQEIEYTGQTGQPQHQVRIRPAVFDISTTLLAKLTNGLANPGNRNVDHFITDYARNDKSIAGGTGEDFRDQTYDALFDPFIDIDGNGIDDYNKLYPYNSDTSLPDHHPLRVNLFQDKLSLSYGDENGMGPYGEWGYLRAPMDDGQASITFDQNKAISRNTGNKHFGPDFFVVIRTSNVATNGDDFRVGISSWGRDPAHLIGSGADQFELGNRGIGFDDRIEDFEAIGPGGGVNSGLASLYPQPSPSYTGSTFGDTSNSRTYTKFLTAVILVDGQAPEDVKTLTASIFEDGASGPNLVVLENQIRLDWEWNKDPDNDRAGVLLVRRKGLAPNLRLLEDGQYYIGPEITKEQGEENRKYLPGYLGFSTKANLTSNVSAGSLLSTAITSTDVSIAHADFADLPIPPAGGKCYLLIGAGVNGDKAEIVSYTTVGATLIIKRGELNTTPVSHSANSSVTFLPPRPVVLFDLLKDTSPTSGSPVLVSVDKTIGLAGFPSTGVIRIGSEIIQYDAVTFGATVDTLNIKSRGLDSTNVMPHSAGSKVYWSYSLTYTSDSIKVDSTSGFPVSGRLRIGNEEIWYNSKTANSFRGVVRGIYTDDAYKTNTPVLAHLAGAEVYDSLYKVIMNDKDLDGPRDFNNDKNEDGIVTTWTDDLYYGEEASAYFYYLFTYDEVLNYSDGKFASVNSMNLKRYTPPTGSGVTPPVSSIVYSNLNLGVKINVKGGETLYFSVEGGAPKFTWVASAAGLQLETVPEGFDPKGESDRYIAYTVPDIAPILNTDIFITVTDTSPNAQTLSVVLFVTEVSVINTDKLYVESDIGTPPVKSNNNVTVQIEYNETITFTATPGLNIPSVIWSSPGPNTFGGQVFLNPAQPNVLRYTAVNPTIPTLTTGTDIISVTDGIDTITITIVVAPNTPPTPPCSTAEPLKVVPGTKGSILVSPGASVTFTAQGGTCSFQWSLIANNSEGSTLTKTDAVHAIYTAGSINRTVDVIELSDGVNTKRIEVHVVSSSSGGGGGGCFIRPTASQRD